MAYDRCTSSFLLVFMVSLAKCSGFTRTGIVSLAALAAVKTFAMSLSTTASSNTPSTNKAALIFLHGLGDTPAGWSSLETHLPSLRPRLSEITYVFPPSPTIPLTINDGAKMPGWFDLYDWPIKVGSRDDLAGLKSAVEIIEKCVQKLEKEGIKRDKIVIGGFSQGGAVALLAAYNASIQKIDGYAGCAILSGWLTLQEQLGEISSEAIGTPLYWGHGERDDKVTFGQQRFGVNTLKKAGLNDMKISEFDMGHSSHPEEIEQYAEFLEKVLFANDVTQEK